METKMVVIPKYVKLHNGALIKTGYKAYSVTTDGQGKIIKSSLKKEK